MEPIRLLLVDDHQLFRESLARLLASEPGFEVVADCVTIDQALDILRGTPVDLVLLDFDLGNECGERFFAASREITSAAKVLMVTAAMTTAQSSAALRLGAAGIFLKHGSPLALIQAIRLIDSGAMWVEPAIVRQLAEHAAAAPTPDQSQLTDREQRVLQGVFEGLANKEIGGRLGVSESAVKSTLQQLFRKARVRTRSQLVRFALDAAPDSRGKD
jgi:DNA-binding NarL/FixJ family response regulator